MLYSLNHYPTCRFEVRQALIYQLVSGLTDENGKYNYAKAVHHYPPFFDISCSAKNYKIASALTVLYGIGTGSGEIVAVALSQVGNVGGQPYWSWYGFSSRVNWCAIFVSWCANECGYIDAGVVPKFAGCVQGSRWFKERGLWQDKSYTPNPGDVIFFDWNDPGGYSGPQDGVPDHVGIVERVENGRVYTIEGNSGDKCCQRSYPVGYYEIYGYGMLCP